MNRSPGNHAIITVGAHQCSAKNVPKPARGVPFLLLLAVWPLAIPISLALYDPSNFYSWMFLLSAVVFGVCSLIDCIAIADSPVDVLRMRFPRFCAGHGDDFEYLSILMPLVAIPMTIVYCALAVNYRSTSLFNSTTGSGISDAAIYKAFIIVLQNIWICLCAGRATFSILRAFDRRRRS